MTPEEKEEKYDECLMEIYRAVLRYSKHLTPKEIIFLLLTQASHVAILHKKTDTDLRDALQGYLDESIKIAGNIVKLHTRGD